ncbi:unnamed protein product [Diplocarpon coronariae]|nr:hypothetical protein JHW43_001465 [Diplocarpon mali]
MDVASVMMGWDGSSSQGPKLQQPHSSTPARLRYISASSCMSAHPDFRTATVLYGNLQAERGFSRGQSLCERIKPEAIGCPLLPSTEEHSAAPPNAIGGHIMKRRQQRASLCVRAEQDVKFELKDEPRPSVNNSAQLSRGKPD